MPADSGSDQHSVADKERRFTEDAGTESNSTANQSSQEYSCDYVCRVVAVI